MLSREEFHRQNIEVDEWQERAQQIKKRQELNNPRQIFW